MVDRSINTLYQIKATAPCFDQSSSVCTILPKMKTILLLSVCLAVITAGAAIPSQTRIVGFSVTMNADGSVLLKGNGLRATLPTNVVSLANALLSYVSSSLGSLKPGSTVSVTLPITTSRNAISYLVNGNTFNITGLQQVGLRQAVEAVERLVG